MGIWEGCFVKDVDLWECRLSDVILKAALDCDINVVKSTITAKYPWQNSKQQVIQNELQR